MCGGCSELSSLDLSNFDTSKVIYMDYMFYLCSKLSYLNLKNFIENDSLEIEGIFYGVSDNIVICLNKNSKKILPEVSNLGYNIDCSFDMNNNLKKEIEYYDKFIKKIENIFTSKDYNTTKLDEGKDEIYETEKMKITFTTSKNQKNNINDNTTIIDLGKCEDELRKFYNLTNNETLYMKKMEITQVGMRISKIEYDVYCKLYGENLIKLKISICNESNIYLYIPANNNGNLDQLNKSSDYYNDICSTATSESKTDITHKDRQKEYINKTVCQDDCDFNGYNYTIQKSICECKVKESSSSFFYMNINKTELLKNFKDIYNVINIKILGCFKNLFSKLGIIKNVASYIIIIIIIIHIIDLCIFFNNQLKKLKKKIKDIKYAIQNIKLIKDDNTKKDKQTKKKGKNKRKEIKLENNIDNEIIKENKNDNKIISKNKKKRRQKKKKKYKAIKNENTAYIDINNKDNIINNNKRNKRNKRINYINTLSGNNTKSENKTIIDKKVVKAMEYINDELNILPYNLALQHDKRTFCQYYISLLKIKHTLLFSFYYSNDYNSKIIKIDLFFVVFSIYYTVNALFYNDDTIHDIYETNGSYSIEYRITKKIYSSIISMAFNKLINFLALSNDEIIKFKQNKKIKKVIERGAVLNYTLRKKFILYFIFGFIFLLFFWYYLSMFGAVYINTQFHLLIDTLESFGYSLLYPFGFCLLPGLFRIPALSDPKKKREYLYKFSKILQMII